jgi:hypothetical protein
MPKLFFALALVALCPAIAAAADSAVPAFSSASHGLPLEESFVYTRTIGDKREEVEIKTRMVNENGASYFELRTHSSDQDGLFKLDPVTLFATYSDITTHSKDATIRRITTVVENRSKPKSDELLVSGIDSLGQSLRLFPWGRQQKAKLLFVGSGGGNFSFELNVSGKETVSIGGRQFECWKAQLGLSGVLGGLFGKTNLWFSTDSPSYLVKSEGPSAGPGSPNSLMELKSRTSSAQSE